MINYIEKEGSIIIACPYSSDISYNKGFCDGVREGVKVISKSQTVDLIEVPKGATYGDMIIELFKTSGDYTIDECNGNFIYLHKIGTPNDECAVAVDRKLWNKQFKRCE